MSRVRSGRNRDGIGKVFFRLAAACALGLLISGCDMNPEIIPKEEIKSPDGQWTVKTQLERWSGPGNNNLASTVYLSQTGISKDPQLILSLTIYNDSEGDVVVRWMDNQHLVLVRPKGAKVGFEVVKMADVEISVQN
jgi:predicted SpoU family rRNA methylase